MAKTLQNKIFETFALSIAGTWHNQSEQEEIRFSLLSTLQTPGAFSILKKGVQTNGLFKLNFGNDNEVFLTFFIDKKLLKQNLKLITSGLLILSQYKENNKVFERLSDTAFADAVISRL